MAIDIATANQKKMGMSLTTKWMLSNPIPIDLFGYIKTNKNNSHNRDSINITKKYSN